MSNSQHHQQQQQQQHQPQRRERSWPKPSTSSFALIFLLFASCCSTVQSFSVCTMGYKPPVQTSVRKIQGSSASSVQRRSTSSSTSKKSTVALGHADVSSSSSYAATSSPPRKKRSSFRDRMKKAVFGNKEENTLKRQRQADLPPNVCEVETLQQFKVAVADETSKLVVVRFYAPWCKACKAMAPHFYRMASQYPQVQFVNVPVTDSNANLHQGLGVPSLPYGHVYHPEGGLVEEMGITRPFIKEFDLKLQSYVQASCPLNAVGDARNPQEVKAERRVSPLATP